MTFQTSHETGYSNKDCRVACDLVALGNGNGKQPVGQLGEGNPSPLRVSLSTARAETPRVSVPGNGQKDESCLQLAFLF